MTELDDMHEAARTEGVEVSWSAVANVVKQARKAHNAWRNVGEAEEMRKLGVLLDKLGVPWGYEP